MFFQDESLTVNDITPNLTYCFKSTILTCVPCVISLIVFIPYVFTISRCKLDRITISWLNVLKMVIFYLYIFFNFLFSRHIVTSNKIVTEIIVSVTCQNVHDFINGVTCLFVINHSIAYALLKS